MTQKYGMINRGARGVRREQPRHLRMYATVWALLLFAQLAVAEEQTMTLMSSAYNSTPAQTDATPNRGAWGDKIEPGMKVIAVSPDLVKLGLKRGVKVRIEGLEGEWVVMDRTPSRLRKRIDIYMGVDIKAARQWGKRKVTIRWSAPSED